MIELSKPVVALLVCAFVALAIGHEPKSKFAGAAVVLVTLALCFYLAQVVDLPTMVRR